MRIPEPVHHVGRALLDHGHQAFLVGGCVRDMVLGVAPKDWDIATNATPDEVRKLFPDSVYENTFGTVGVKTESEDPTLAVVEVTTFRIEGRYSDKRHPDEITFAKSIEEDLSRRDFTVNAMAMSLEARSEKQELRDPYGGQEDLKNKIIRAVGDARQRFDEDALRLLRAVRFAAQLGFSIEDETMAALKEKAPLLEFVASERIRDEFSKLIMTKYAADGMRLLQQVGLLRFILPELSLCAGVEQNKHHIYDVFEHSVRALEYAVKRDYSFAIRLASLLHDVGKPESRRWQSDRRGAKELDGKKGDWTFYQHQYIGERMALQMLDRLHFSKDLIEDVALLVREHMFVYDPELVTDKGVRRLLRRIGTDHVDDLIRVREADRIGSGVPKAQPYRLRHLQAMIEKEKQAPVSPKMLKANGEDVMRELGIEPGRRVGMIIAVLLEDVLDDPERNTKEWLTERMRELQSKSDVELKELAERGKETARKTQQRIDDEIKRKYRV